MSSRPHRFKQTDITRVAKAMKAAGAPNARISIALDGTITVDVDFVGSPSIAPQQHSSVETSATAFDKWQEMKRARQA
jgi:hypothetical protein